MTTMHNDTPSAPAVPFGKTMTEEDWVAEGEARFGADRMRWRFRCPVCGHDQSVEDYQRAGAPENAIGFSCVGRWIEGSKEAFDETSVGPCNYAGGGLFRLNPITVVSLDAHQQEHHHKMFAFGDAIDE